MPVTLTSMQELDGQPAPPATLMATAQTSPDIWPLVCRSRSSSLSSLSASGADEGGSDHEDDVGEDELSEGDRTIPSNGNTSSAAASASQASDIFRHKCLHCHPPLWFRSPGLQNAHVRREHTSYEHIRVSLTEVYKVARSGDVFLCPFCKHSSIYAGWLSEHYFSGRKANGRQCRIEDHLPLKTVPVNWTRLEPDNLPPPPGPKRLRMSMSGSLSEAKEIKRQKMLPSTTSLSVPALPVGGSFTTASDGNSEVARPSSMATARVAGPILPQGSQFSRLMAGEGPSARPTVSLANDNCHVPATSTYSPAYWSSDPTASTQSPRLPVDAHPPLSLHRPSSHSPIPTYHYVALSPVFTLPSFPALPFQDAIEAQAHVAALNSIYRRNAPPLGTGWHATTSAADWQSPPGASRGSRQQGVQAPPRAGPYGRSLSVKQHL